MSGTFASEKLHNKDSFAAGRLPRILARKFANSHLDEEDLFQEGMIAYIRAEQTFDPARDIKFETYASRVIKNRFIDIIRRQPDNDAVFDDDKTTSDFSLDDEVNLLEIKKIVANHVDEIERAIFNSYIEGFSYEEMGKIFDMPRKRIDNVVQKVKKIIKSHMTH